MGGFWHMELHITGLCVWFCRNDPKIIKHAAELPAGVHQRIGARLSELPGHMTLAYDVPNGIAHQMQLLIREYFKEVCVRGGKFGKYGILHTEPLVPVFVSDIDMSTLQTRAPYDWAIMRERQYDPLCAYLG